MEFSAEMIASYLEGEIIGDRDTKVCSVAKIEDAEEGSLAFLANPKYEHHIYTTKASIVLVNDTFTPSESVQSTLIKVKDAYKAFASLLDLYVANKPQKEGISSNVSISPNAKIGENVYIGAYTVIEDGVVVGDNCRIYPQVYLGDNVKIGSNTTIFAGVKVYDECEIGDNVIIHSGAVIGADGFGFAPIDGTYKKIAQIGNVIIENDVEVGANTCIDRATMGSTLIKKGVKLDNLIQIGHNATIGENSAAAAHVAIAGSANIGSNCIIGGQVGIAGHINIANGTQIASQSGIGSTIKNENTILLGSPAFDISIARRSIAAYKNLPKMLLDIRALKTEIQELKKSR